MIKTLGIPTPEGKLYLLTSIYCFNCGCISLFSLPNALNHILTVILVRVLVKNANDSVIAAEDVVLSYVVAVLPSSLNEVLNVALALSRPLLEHLHCLVVTLGAHGLLLCGEHDAGSVNLQPRKQKRVTVTYVYTDHDFLL